MGSNISCPWTLEIEHLNTLLDETNRTHRKEIATWKKTVDNNIEQEKKLRAINERNQEKLAIQQRQLDRLEYFESLGPEFFTCYVQGTKLHQHWMSDDVESNYLTEIVRFIRKLTLTNNLTTTVPSPTGCDDLTNLAVGRVPTTTTTKTKPKFHPKQSRSKQSASDSFHRV